jgi:neutral ceramidase
LIGGMEESLMMRSTRGPLCAGAAKVDITPRDFTSLTNLWGRAFEGVHDPIFLRALVVDNGINTAAIVAADLVEFGDTSSVRKRIAEEIGIPFDHIIMTASHDHNAPRVGVVTAGATAHAGGPATAAYTEMVYDQIVEAVRQAQAALQPARLGVGTGMADANTNRDEYTPDGWKLGVNPEGPSEKTVWVVKFETTSGEPIAILMNYAVHSVVLGAENRLLTGDLAGAAERFVEQHYQDKVVALWTLGPAGDQNPKYVSWNTDSIGDREPGYLLMDALGQIVGEEVVRVAEQIEHLISDVRIEAQQRIVTCPGRTPTRNTQHDGLKFQPVDSLGIHLGLVLINHIALTAVSGEVVTRIYHHLKKDSPLLNTILITLSNDRVGYIVDDASYDIPTFESTNTPLQRGYAEAAIVHGLVEMMEQYL